MLRKDGIWRVCYHNAHRAARTFALAPSEAQAVEIGEACLPGAYWIEAVDWEKVCDASMRDSLA